LTRLALPLITPGLLASGVLAFILKGLTVGALKG